LETFQLRLKKFFNIPNWKYRQLTLWQLSESWWNWKTITVSWQFFSNNKSHFIQTFEKEKKHFIMYVKRELFLQYVHFSVVNVRLYKKLQLENCLHLSESIFCKQLLDERSKLLPKPYFTGEEEVLTIKTYKI